jgi:NADPH:quinone reductase-like Zn-dependent oxidoreductase
MKAAVHTRYGPPEVVRVAEVARPAVKDGEVLVEVHATTVNRTDCGMRAAKPFLIRLFTGLRRPRLTVLGNEFAGTVAEVGPGVTGFAVGDRVFGFSGTRFGAHAEYLAMPEHGPIATMPAGLTWEQAAAGTEGSGYALNMLRTIKVQAGQDVLVNGASGAIGSAAVQLLKHAGARVTAVTDTANLELVKGLGADRVVDYTAEDFTTDGQSYDAVLDAVGKSSFGRCRRLLKPGGVYVSSDLGPLSQNPLLALVTPLLAGRKVRFPLPSQRDQATRIRQLGELIESGAFQPLIDRHYPLDRIVEAYTYVETGRKLGNVVIDVRSGE